VLRLWSGLGYNSRALRLHSLAKIIRDKYNGSLPDTYEQLLELPGVGPYTAAAVVAFAHNRPAPVVDVNIRRVIMHHFNIESSSISDRQLRALSLEIAPTNKTREWFGALMDYGALKQTARRTGIPKAGVSQSAFEGSDRQIRGWIVKQVLSNRGETIRLRDVQEYWHEKALSLGETHTTAIASVNARIWKIVNKLVSDGVVELLHEPSENEHYIRLPS